MPAREKTITVKVFSPFETFYEGPAVSLSGINATGPFDVLAGHAKFFSILEQGNVEVDTGQQHLRIPLERGIIVVAENRATVYAGL